MNLPEIEIAGEELFKVFGFHVTNTFLIAIILGVAIFFFSFLSLRNGTMIPKKMQNFWEFILESLYNFFNSITGDPQKTKEIFPLTATIFILILFFKFDKSSVY